MEKIAEENQKTLQLAERFDRLGLAGWDAILKAMADRIHQEITQARIKPDLTQDQQVHVVRWNAMQDVVDTGLNLIRDTLKRREEILEEERQLHEQMGEQVNA